VKTWPGLRILAAIAVMAVAGCAPHGTAPPGSRSLSSHGRGVLYGTVAFPAAGPAAAAASDTSRGNTAAAKLAASRSFRDVVVYLERVPENLPPLPAAGPARLPNDPHVRAGAEPAHHRTTVVHRSNRFVPRVIAIDVGDTVMFENADRLYHNVFSVAPEQEFNIGMLAPGTSKTRVFTKPGVVPIFCELHTRTAGYVFVAPTPVYVRAAANGAWSLRPLPAGDYVVHAWHPELGDRRWEVSLPREGRRFVVRF
jgi:plastocyanin